MNSNLTSHTTLVVKGHTLVQREPYSITVCGEGLCPKAHKVHVCISIHRKGQHGTLFNSLLCIRIPHVLSILSRNRHMSMYRVLRGTILHPVHLSVFIINKLEKHKDICVHDFVMTKTRKHQKNKNPLIACRFLNITFMNILSTYSHTVLEILLNIWSVC